jgi:hypothetical protein
MFHLIENDFCSNVSIAETPPSPPEMAATPLVAAIAEVSISTQFGTLFLPKFVAKSKTIFSQFRPHYLRFAKVSKAVLSICK